MLLDSLTVKDDFMAKKSMVRILLEKLGLRQCEDDSIWEMARLLPIDTELTIDIWLDETEDDRDSQHSPYRIKVSAWKDRPFHIQTNSVPFLFYRNVNQESVLDPHIPKNFKHEVTPDEQEEVRAFIIRFHKELKQFVEDREYGIGGFIRDLTAAGVGKRKRSNNPA